MRTNLTTSTELLLRLLDDDDWRERLVEELIFGAGEHVRVISTYQLVVSEDVVGTVTHTRPEHARLVLPLGTRDKRALLDFSVRGPSGADALLLPRGLTAQLQATYLDALVASSGVPAPFGPRTRDLLEAICVFTPSLFRRLVGEEGEWHTGMARYLEGGLELPRGMLPPELVRAWCEQSQTRATTLPERLDEPASVLSSSEHVLLALPDMERASRPSSTSEIACLLEAYHAGLDALSAAGADDALVLLAEYGRRWQVFIETDVPIGSRFKVRLAEDRPLGLDGRRSRQRFAINGAASAHLEARVIDHSVGLDAMEVRTLTGSTLHPRLVEARRLTPEAASVYSSNRGRPQFVDVDIALRVRPHVVAAPVSFAIVALAATVVALLIPDDDELATKLGVVAVPVTITAAVLLIRDESALAARLQRPLRTIVVVLTIALWAAVVVRLVARGAELPRW